MSGDLYEGCFLVGHGLAVGLFLVRRFMAASLCLRYCYYESGDLKFWDFR